ncbi:PDR/VanB family oxidoreductase [Pseudonocardia kujensis]|uniref:PDR/VanB family oxidoreductase n=1 Tax=Pseudonocardia kujensis TaxID=1128675 RepID=UPI001E303E34|nr:PDR/VanB family oxidoreductase [Pseudonocardia kujensis]MCE0761928.1 PDR/VanB family oxidoreductase [Pseudonocardia kujensis]
MTNTTVQSRANTGLTLEEARFRARVEARAELADGVVELTLVPTGEGPVPPWRPGAHIDLAWDDGLVRQYSLCGDPEDRTRYTVAVLLEPEGRGGSRRIHETLQAGSEVEVRGPRNHFHLEPAERHVFVAGGIGITPILAMIGELDRAGKPWTLVYGGRRRESMAYADRLAALGPHVRLWPQDERGLIDLADALGEPTTGTAVYACGPEPLLRALEEHCAAHWPTGSLHVERFAPQDIDTSGDTPFEIELADGRVLTVPADRSALVVLAEAGIDILSSCEEGTCGTCEVEIVAGEADHRDTVLTPEEREENCSMMVCVSRAACARLKLDL